MGRLQQGWRGVIGRAHDRIGNGAGGQPVAGRSAAGGQAAGKVELAGDGSCGRGASLQWWQAPGAKRGRHQAAVVEGAGVSRGVCYGAHKSLRGACHASTCMRATVHRGRGAAGTLAAPPDTVQGGQAAGHWPAFWPAQSSPWPVGTTNRHPMACSCPHLLLTLYMCVYTVGFECLVLHSGLRSLQA